MIRNVASIRKDRDDHTADLFFVVTVLFILEEIQKNRDCLLLQKLTSHLATNTYIFNALQHQYQLFMAPCLIHAFHQDLCHSKFAQYPMKRIIMRNLLDNPQQIQETMFILDDINQFQQSSNDISINKSIRLVVLYKYCLDFLNCALDVSLLVLV